MLLGEPYRLAVFAQNTCKRAYKLLAESDRTGAASESKKRYHAKDFGKVRRSRSRVVQAVCTRMATGGSARHQ